MNKIKSAFLIAFGLLAMASSALASTPTYKCGATTNIENAKNPVLLTLNDDGSIGVTATGTTRKMERSSENNAPAGYSAYTGEMGCPESPTGPTQMMKCGVISLSTLFVTYPMVSGTPQGKAVLNGQSLYCAMQMMD
jgi:hypothetical protein